MQLVDFLPWRFGARAGQPEPASRQGLGASSFGLLALRLDADLVPGEAGCSVLLTAVAEEAVAVESITELAWHLAEEQGRSVLLVDGTFGLGSLSQALGVDGAAGLTDLLLAATVDDPALAAAEVPTAHPGVKLLPRGSQGPGQLVAARSNSLSQLLQSAQARHDFVLIQGSLRNDSSRSLAFVPHVSAILLVVVDGQSDLQVVRRSQALLNECGARRVGLVLATTTDRSPSAAG